MKNIIKIIEEELDTLYQANFPRFGDRLNSISEEDNDKKESPKKKKKKEMDKC